MSGGGAAAQIAARAQRLAAERGAAKEAKEGAKPFLVRCIPKPVRSLYRRVMPRPVRVFLRTRTAWFWWFALAFGVGQPLAIRVGFGVVFLCVALVAAMLLNLDYSRKGGDGPSAYSVFNRDQRRLAGQLDSAEYDRMLRSGFM